MKYRVNGVNGESNIITTDDVIVGGNNSNVNLTLKDVLDDQDKKLNQLSRNVKWLAKYGGVGGSSSGSSTENTKFKFSATIYYTNLQGELASQEVRSTNIQSLILQVLKNTIITVNAVILSLMLDTSTYSLVMNYGTSSKVSTTFDKITRLASVTFALPSSFNCKLLVFGELTFEIPIQCFTTLATETIELRSGNNILGTNSIIYLSYKTEGVVLYINILNLISNVFKISSGTLSINNTIINDFTSTTTDDSIVLELNINNYLSQYGILKIKYIYNLIDCATNISTPITVEYLAIYKDDNSTFIYCYSEDPLKLIISNSNTTTPSIVYSLNNIKVLYKIYGTRDSDFNTSYNVYINQNLIKLGARQDVEYEYYLTNNSTNNIGEWLEFLINVSGEEALPYYIFVKKPETINYLFTTTNSLLCYGAVGSNNASLGSTIFPSFNSGSSYIPNDETIINCNTSDFSLTLFVNYTGITSVKDLVLATKKTPGTLNYDAVINIGVNYKDISYSDYIISIDGTENNTQGNKLLIYRDKLIYDENSETDKFAMPCDGKFHLITVYIKNGYYVNSLNDFDFNSVLSNTYISIFIDGIIEVAPIACNSFKLGTNLKIKLNLGLSEYNHFGVYYINPKKTSEADWSVGYAEVLKKYLLDFDYILVSNYYMIYNNKDNYIYLNNNNQTLYSEYPSSQLLSINTYDLVSGGWLNYYKPDLSNTHFKFLNIDKETIALMVDLDKFPIYKIVPVLSDINTRGLNSFVYNTSSKYEEGSDVPLTTCTLYKLVQTAGAYSWKSLFNPKYLVGDDLVDVEFEVTYQGSSTLSYGVKNFKISIKEDTKNNKNYELYFNPNPKLLTTGLWSFPEKSFNLKADLIDSSSCTNNVIANFVNSYMESPFGDNTLTCLSGFPVLLFIENAVNGIIDSKKDLFLGIYNFNLGREAYNNLGYLVLPSNWEEQCYPSTVDSSYLYIRNKDVDAIDYSSRKFYVAEILGNSGVFDFTLWNDNLLKKMYGDYFYNVGTGIRTDYFTALKDLSQDFATVCYNTVIKNNQTNSTGQYRFNLYNYNYDNLINKRSSLGDLYGNIYYIENGNKQQITDGLIVDANEIDYENIPYHSLFLNTRISEVGNPLYQFCPVVNVNNDVIGSYYYVKRLDSISYNATETYHTFDLQETLKYYITCMLFSMVDSVQKNLTIKCNYTANPHKWYPAFYDMDTGLGLDNAGGNSNYKAFSDYINDSGEIILDYAPLATSGWFDTPSSYLFMYAKYYALINSLEGSLDSYTPYHYWCALRGFNTLHSSYPGYNLVQNALSFCDNYLYKYIEGLPPLIWNLNYSYKYFSSSLLTGDATEAHRFNGTMKYRRLDWLSNRLHYLDVLFGIGNTRYVGLDTSATVGDVLLSQDNSDILICQSLFPKFTKGTIGRYSASIKDRARIPFIIKYSTNQFKVGITNGEGMASFNFTTASNDVGLLGSKNFNYVSESGQFLCAPNVANTVEGDFIKQIKITSPNFKTISLKKSTAASLEEIFIGSEDSNVILTPVDSNNISIDGDNKVFKNITLKNLNSPNANIIIQNATIKKLIIQNVTCSSLTLKSCTIESYIDLDTELSINLTNSINIKSITINNCASGNINITSSSITTIDLDGTSAENSNIKISCSNLSGLKLDRVTCNTFTNSDAHLLRGTINSNNEEEFKISSITIENLLLNTKCKDVYSYRYKTPSCGNSYITKISISSTYKGKVKLALPGFYKTTELSLLSPVESTSLSNYRIIYFYYKFVLLKHGLAWMKIADLPYYTSGSNNNSANILYLVELDEDASYCFRSCNNLIHSTSFASYSDTIIAGIFSNCRNATGLFSSYGLAWNANANLIRNIIKNLPSGINCDYLFYYTQNGNIATSSQLAISDAFFLKVNEGEITSYTGAFFNSFLLILGGALATYTNVTELNLVIGDCEVVTKSLVNIKKLITYSNIPGTITFVERTGTEPNIIKTKKTEVILKDELPKCTYIATRIYSNISDLPENNVVVDFTNWNLNSTLEYYHIFGHLKSVNTMVVCNTKNYVNWINTNFNNITFQGFDDFWWTKSINISSLATLNFNTLDSYYIDLWNLLTKSVDDLLQLRSKTLVNFITASLTDENLYAFNVPKFITYQNLVALINLLESENITNISRLFSNCLILYTGDGSNINSINLYEQDRRVTITLPSLDTDETLYYKTTNNGSVSYQLFTGLSLQNLPLVCEGNNLPTTNIYTGIKGLLSPFKNFYKTFDNAYFYKASGTLITELYLNLDKAFVPGYNTYSELETIYLYLLVDGEYISYNLELEIPKIEDIQTSNKVNSLENTFLGCYLNAFTNSSTFTLGISDDTATSLKNTFYNCNYYYITLDSSGTALHNDADLLPNISTLSSTMNALLPLNFLNFVKSGLTLTNTFANSTSTLSTDKEKVLHGIIFENQLFRDSSLGTILYSNSFQNALVYYNLKTDENNNVEAFIFPEWYIDKCSQFNVLIPFPPSNDVYANKTYLFYYSDNTKILPDRITKYTKLPHFSAISSTSTKEWYFNSYVANYILIKPTNLIKYYLLPSVSDGVYKELLPGSLGILLNAAPPIANDSNQADYTIFNNLKITDDLYINTPISLPSKNYYFGGNFNNLSESIKNLIL